MTERLHQSDDGLVQVTLRRGDVARVPNGETPVVELDLSPGQYIAAFELRPHKLVFTERKTTDWSWTAYVVTPL